MVPQGAFFFFYFSSPKPASALALTKSLTSVHCSGFYFAKVTGAALTPHGVSCSWRSRRGPSMARLLYIYFREILAVVTFFVVLSFLTPTCSCPWVCLSIALRGRFLSFPPLPFTGFAITPPCPRTRPADPRVFKNFSLFFFYTPLGSLSKHLWYR